jgi:hypothetical protein
MRQLSAGRGLVEALRLQLCPPVNCQCGGLTRGESAQCEKRERTMTTGQAARPVRSRPWPGPPTPRQRCCVCDRPTWQATKQELRTRASCGRDRARQPLHRGRAP